MQKAGDVALVVLVLLVLSAGCKPVRQHEVDGGGSELRIVTQSLRDANREVPYETQLEVTGGMAPYEWSATDLPPGLSLDGGGIIVGTPTEPGEYEVSLSVTDDAGETDAAGLGLIVTNLPTITSDSLPTVHVLERYTEGLELLSGAPPYTWTAAGLPDGLELDSATGEIRNDPDAPAITDATPVEVTVTVVDDAGASESASFSLDIVGVDSVTAGSNQTCALDVAGAAWCWGRNDSGELGNDDSGTDIAVPVRVSGGQSFTNVASGLSWTCGIDDAGAGWCWGSNTAGQLGNNDTGNGSLVPVQVSGGHTWTALSLGRSHACAVDDANTAWCWGRNGNGELGNDDLGTDSPVPVQVSGGLSVTDISAGDRYTCALDSGGAAWCWGRDSHGELGYNNTGTRSPVPVEVSGGHTFTAVTAGRFHACALDGDGATWCWGDNNNGALGNDDLPNDSPVPVQVSGGQNFTIVTAGSSHTCAIDDAGAGWCWGSNLTGQLGNNDTGNGSPVPVQVSGGHGFTTSISAEAFAYHTCAVDDTDTAWCWGSGGSGRLGNNDPDSLSPVPGPVQPGE